MTMVHYQMVLGLQLAAAGRLPGVSEPLLELQDIPDITESLDGAAAAVGSWGALRAPCR